MPHRRLRPDLVREENKMPKTLRKLLGLILLFATVGVASWQALLVL